VWRLWKLSISASVSSYCIKEERFTLLVAGDDEVVRGVEDSDADVVVGKSEAVVDEVVMESGTTNAFFLLQSELKLLPVPIASDLARHSRRVSLPRAFNVNSPVALSTQPLI
jgi:hypothetical protein